MLGIKTIDFFYEVIIQLSLKFTAAQRTRMHYPLKHMLLFIPRLQQPHDTQSPSSK